MAFRSLLTSFFLSGALVSTGANAWYFDSSCKPYETFLSQAMQNAFDMAEFGRRGLQDVVAGSGTQQEKDLADNLFGPSNITKYDDVLARFTALHRSPLVVKQVNGWDPSNHADVNVVIFCDYSRLKPLTAQNKIDATKIGADLKNRDWMWDTVMQWPVEVTPGKGDQICRDRKAGEEGAIDALTNALRAPNDIMYSSTQLCPWYIQRLAGSAKKTLSDIPDFPSFARAGQAISNVTRGFMPVSPGAGTMNVSVSRNGSVFEHPAQPSGPSTLSTSTLSRPTDFTTGPRPSRVVSPDQLSSILPGLPAVVPSSSSSSLRTSATPVLGVPVRLRREDLLNGGPANGTNAQYDVAQTAGDTVDLLDITLLHEMTHTRAAVLHPTVEVPTKDIVMSGWEATTQIRLNGSEFNAESFALYGWSCWLNSKGVSVMRNGSIIPWV